MSYFIRIVCTTGLFFVSFLSISAGEAEFADTVRMYDVERDTVSHFNNLAWSDTRIARMEKLAVTWQGTLTATDFKSLDQEERIDWLLMRERLVYEQGKIAQDRERLEQIAELIPFRSIIESLEVARWRMLPMDSAASAKTLAVVPDQIRTLRTRLEKGQKKTDVSSDKKDEGKENAVTAPEKAKEAVDQAPLLLTPLLAFRTARTVDGVRRALKTWYEEYAGSKPDFIWWVKSPFEETDKALEEYAKYLRENIAGVKGEANDPLLGEALGANGLKRDLSLEFMSYSAQELLAIGEREFAWCEARMVEAARAMNFGDDWHAALVKVKGLHVPPGKQDDYIAEQAAEAIAFIKHHDLVTVPALCEETWRISMVSSDEQKHLPYVAYDGMNMLAAYARDDMSNEDKLMSMRGNNRHFTRLTTAHELIPGHHLQSYFAQRYRSYRSLFSTPFFVEGWALYWEMALWDQGYARSPEDQIGMLFWRMHRAARIIVTLKFHLGDMTPPQMVDFLVNRVGHERFGATSEVRRFIAGDYSPLYQCAYMIGGLQLRALAKTMTANGIMTTKQFNDAVLRCGPIPIEMLRASLLKLPLTPEYKPQWRFAE